MELTFFVKLQVRPGEYVFLRSFFFILHLRETDLLWPSSGTTCNKKRQIENDQDIDDLCGEIQDFPAQTILDCHLATRLRGKSSGITITEVLAMKIYLKRYEYESTYETFN